MTSSRIYRKKTNRKCPVMKFKHLDCATQLTDDLNADAGSFNYPSIIINQAILLAHKKKVSVRLTMCNWRDSKCHL